MQALSFLFGFLLSFSTHADEQFDTKTFDDSSSYGILGNFDHCKSDKGFVLAYDKAKKTYWLHDTMSKNTNLTTVKSPIHKPGYNSQFSSLKLYEDSPTHTKYLVEFSNGDFNVTNVEVKKIDFLLEDHESEDEFWAHQLYVTLTEGSEEETFIYEIPFECMTTLSND